MPKVDKDFGRKLRKLRTSTTPRLTQMELAKILGMSNQSIWAYESGRFLPSPKTAAKILGYFAGRPIEEAPKKPTKTVPPRRDCDRPTPYPTKEESILTDSAVPSPVRLGKVSADWLNMTIDNHVSACGYALLDGPSKYVLMPRAGLTELCRVILKAGGISVE